MRKSNLDCIATILAAVRVLAIRYYQETGKPLGITGEIAEFEAARLLGLELAEPRQAGYDALWIRDDGRSKRVQIKGRRVSDASKSGGRPFEITTFGGTSSHDLGRPATHQ